MTDWKKMLKLMEDLRDSLYASSKELQRLVHINQNPNCGGDRSMTEEEWIMARDFLNKVNDLERQKKAIIETVGKDMLDYGLPGIFVTMVKDMASKDESGGIIDLLELWREGPTEKDRAGAVGCLIESLKDHGYV